MTDIDTSTVGCGRFHALIMAQAAAKEQDAQLRRARGALEDEKRQLAEQRGLLTRRQTQVRLITLYFTKPKVV